MDSVTRLFATRSFIKVRVARLQAGSISSIEQAFVLAESW
jgi:hypothetical protein